MVKRKDRPTRNRVTAQCLSNKPGYFTTKASHGRSRDHVQIEPLAQVQFISHLTTTPQLALPLNLRLCCTDLFTQRPPRWFSSSFILIIHFFHVYLQKCLYSQMLMIFFFFTKCIFPLSLDSTQYECRLTTILLGPMTAQHHKLFLITIWRTL